MVASGFVKWGQLHPFPSVKVEDLDKRKQFETGMAANGHYSVGQGH